MEPQQGVDLCCPKCEQVLATLKWHHDTVLILNGEVKIKCTACPDAPFAIIGLPNSHSFLGAEKGKVHEF